MDTSDHVLKVLHGVAALFHFIQFGYSEALVNTIFKDKSTFNLVNSVATRPGEVGVLRDNEIGHYQLSQLVPIFSLLSCVNHTWSLFDFKRYTTFVEQGYNPVRWAEYSISSGLMLWVVASLSGVINIQNLSFLVLSNLALQFTGFSIEKDIGRSIRSTSESQAEHLYQSGLRQEVIGFCIFAAQMIPIWIAFFTSAAQNEDEMPDFVWAIIFILTAFFISFGVLSIVYLRGANRKLHGVGFKSMRQPDFKIIEIGYLILSFLSKTFLMNIVLFGTAQSREYNPTANLEVSVETYPA